MTAPRQANTAAGGQRFYQWRDEKFWSVTTIIGGGVPKPALINWAKKFTAEYAVEHVEALKVLVKDDPKGAVDWLKNAAYRDRDQKADLGTQVHNAVEAYILGKPYPKWPKTIEPRMLGFVQFLEDYEPVFQMTEASVYNRTQRYAGTLDGIAEFDRRRLILDMKSGKAIYPEVALQLSAYAHAEFIGMPDGSEAPLPALDGAAALHLPAEGGYQFLDVRAIDADVFNAFLFVREVFKWQQQTSKSVILGPLSRSTDASALELATALASGEEKIA